MRNLFSIFFTLAACGPPTAAPPPPPVTAPPPVSVFEPDAAPTGPTLSLTVSPDFTTADIWAKDLGSVFGLSFHLSIDSSQLAFESVSPSDAFGGSAKTFGVIHGADASFGLVLPHPKVTPVDLIEPTKVATVRLSRKAAVDSRLSIERITIRRIDGSWITARAAGGRLVLP